MVPGQRDACLRSIPSAGCGALSGSQPLGGLGFGWRRRREGSRAGKSMALKLGEQNVFASRDYFTLAVGGLVEESLV